MAEPSGGGPLSFLFPTLKRVKPKKAEEPKKTAAAPSETKSSSQGGQGGQGGSVTVIPQTPPSAPVAIDFTSLSPFGQPKKPMSAADFQAVLDALGLTMPSDEMPALPVFDKAPAIESLPLDLRPMAGWIDNMFGTSYSKTTPSAEDFMNAAMKARALVGDSPAVQQARAQAELAKYQALLEQSGPQARGKFIDAVTGGRGLTSSLEAIPTPSAPVAPSTVPSTVSSTGTGPSAKAPSGGPKAKPGGAKAPRELPVPKVVVKLPPGAENLPMNQQVAILERERDNQQKYQDSIIAYNNQMKNLTADLADKAANDPEIQKYANDFLPKLQITRNILASDKTGGLASLTAMELFHKLVEPVAVHQSDIENAQRMQGLSNRFLGWLEQLRGGKAIGPGGIEDMFRVMSEMQTVYGDHVNKVIRQHEELAGLKGSTTPEVVGEAARKKAAKPTSTFRIRRKGETEEKEITVPASEREATMKKWKGPKDERGRDKFIIIEVGH